ncbi:helix-turn-helix transcriptional regulator [Pedobacter frigidisoli]|uniref:helix-turn-helix domain-containing protein n=1 Tax=Pedobacter frigidisoli TaxID=2530455 RepID=UPI00293123B7|nr:helix-turn-helix transcriptional regulator [Pedobacter frigidisoli]
MAERDKKLEEAIEKKLIEIGRRLKVLRKKQGYSSPDHFAYEKGVNRSQYGKYEAGRTNITIGSLMALLAHHGLKLEDFLSEEFNTLYPGEEKK